ncbi:MAG: oligopeptide/dipeptide ABC transporter ATP-binding protein [bacterium]
MCGRMALLKIVNLTKTYPLSAGTFRKTKAQHAVVKNVSLDIMAGECLALVGESGCGKTTLGRCLLRLVRASAGRVLYKNRDLLQLSEKEFRAFRPKFQMIFQDPLQALNPRQSIGACLIEPLKLHGRYLKKDLTRRVEELLTLVGLQADIMTRYPHELSGGERQRIAIARTLATNPIFIIADEPTSSLDASIKRQIIELLLDLKRRLGLTLLLISHDLSMVYKASDRIAVIYKGRVVEIASTNQLIHTPVHPYSKLLVQSASCQVSPESQLLHFSTAKNQERQAESCGCEFSECCPWAEAICFYDRPDLKKISVEHLVACHLIDKINAIRVVNMKIPDLIKV